MWGVSHGQLIVFITLVCSQKEGRQGSSSSRGLRTSVADEMMMMMMMKKNIFYRGTGTKCTANKISNPKQQNRRDATTIVRQWRMPIRVSDNMNKTMEASGGINRWNLTKTMESNRHDWTRSNAAAMVDDDDDGRGCQRRWTTTMMAHTDGNNNTGTGTTDTDNPTTNANTITCRMTKQGRQQEQRDEADNAKQEDAPTTTMAHQQGRRHYTNTNNTNVTTTIAAVDNNNNNDDEDDHGRHPHEDDEDADHGNHPADGPRATSIRQWRSTTTRATRGMTMMWMTEIPTATGTLDRKTSQASPKACLYNQRQTLKA
jgi:hypothetical protein